MSRRQTPPPRLEIGNARVYETYQYNFFIWEIVWGPISEDLLDEEDDAEIEVFPNDACSEFNYLRVSRDREHGFHCIVSRYFAGS